ncbi:unnamed protein product [Rhizoctonia solani]|uniref:MYND-type domain-containing protein n=1 Tax=Rhizoctonia solani TaxID=456999 RepID=A0A8H3AH64_9AGAM|nr:unnamed protein product [Rhizoctonia solani]
MQILGHYVSVTIWQEISTKDESRLNWITGWINVEGRPKHPPLATIPDIELLSTMLWDDRKLFFKSLKSTYYPGISAVIFVNPIMPHLTILNEIAFRYYLIATSDQQHAISYMNMDIGAGKHLSSWERNTQLVDLEDCREVVGAYVGRFNPHPILYYPISVLDGPIFLRSLAQFVVPGTEDLLPAILGVTAKRIWEEIKDPSEEYKPDVYVDCIRDTFTNYATIIQSRTFSRMNDTLFQELVDHIIKQDLIDLAARAMLLLELPSEPPAHHLAGSADYLPRIQRFYRHLSESIPKQYIFMISDHFFPEWFKFRSYLTWCPEIRRLVPGDRDHMKKCLWVWNDIGRALGYQILENSQFKCLYARCHDPLGMEGVQFTCPICHNGAYCRARCQSLDWKFGGLHADSCIGAKALVIFRPSV